MATSHGAERPQSTYSVSWIAVTDALVFTLKHKRLPFMSSISVHVDNCGWSIAPR